MRKMGPTTDGLPPASQSGTRTYRRDKQQQVKKAHKMDRRRAMRERSFSTGSTREAFGSYTDVKEHPPVEQVTLSRNRAKNVRVDVSNGAAYDTVNRVTNCGISNPEDITNAVTLAMKGQDEENGEIYYKDQKHRKRNQVNEVLNHTPLPRHPDSCDNDGPENFAANRHHRDNLSYNFRNQIEDNYSPRSHHYSGRNRSSLSTLNGERLRQSVSFNSNEAASSCSRQADSCDFCSQSDCDASSSASNVNTLEEDSNNNLSYNSYGPDDMKITWLESKYKLFIYDNEVHEFTSLQQSFWAVVIGVIMGVLTALWGGLVDVCVDFVWKTVPEYFYEIGVFTDLDGHLPLPYYMVICPGLFGGVLSYISAIITIPGMNEWIESLHSMGIMDHSKLVPTFLISTAGMASGLSLGPELPLVLTAGMVGSYFGYYFYQTILSARVMNITAASAAIAGFFGFPMAGALFILELPHRMGLQYFEAISPATLASIFAVLVNRIVTGDEVKGYFEYPQLNATLPSYMFGIAFGYAIVGLGVGVVYVKVCLFLKKWVHHWFQFDHHDEKEQRSNPETDTGEPTENAPLLHSRNEMLSKSNLHLHHSNESRFIESVGKFSIDEPTRAAVAGTLAGIIVGVVCMFVPHNLFWGEAQLQSLMDRGRTPLPVFGYGNEPTALLTAYGYCIIDPEDDNTSPGFGTTCAGIITATKILVTGLSLGTGIVGGHFWGPLYVGCAASHFFIDIWSILCKICGFGSILTELANYPCVAMLCIMGSAHVVTYRAYIAITLILTLSIKSFTAEFSGGASGDYSAIFPVMVVACFISLQATKKSAIFYATQRSRGDIEATPDVLCVPNPEGSISDDDTDAKLEWRLTEKTATSSYDKFGEDSNISIDESHMEVVDDIEGRQCPSRYGNLSSPSRGFGEAINPAKQITASCNRLPVESQFNENQRYSISPGNAAIDGNDLNFDCTERPSDSICCNNLASPVRVSSGGGNTAELDTDGQEQELLRQQTLDIPRYKSGQVPSPSRVTTLHVNTAEPESDIQLEERSHRRVRSGGTHLTNPETIAYVASKLQRHKNDSLVRSGSSVSSLRSAGKIEDFTDPLLVQAQNCARTRSRSNTPRRLSGTRSRSNTPRRKSGATRSFSNSSRPIAPHNLQGANMEQERLNVDT